MKIVKPLNYLTKKDSMFNFNKECNTSFKELKDRLYTAPIIYYYNSKLECMLETNALDRIVAIVLL